MSGSPPRICIINDGLYPSRWTDTQQTVKTAAALAAQGAHVELVVPRRPRAWFVPHHARQRELDEYYGIQAGFELTQIPGLPRSPLKLDEALHGIAAPLYALTGRHDVVYSRRVVPIATALATGQYVIFESHRVLKAHYPMAHRVVSRLRTHPRFLGVVTNARIIADAFIEMGFSPDAVVVAHNCYDPSDIAPALSQPSARRQVGLAADRPVVCYAGHIQKRKGIETVIALAARTPEIQWVICGGFPADVAEAEARAASEGAANLTFTGWIDVHKLSPYLYAASVLLIPPTAAPLREYGNTVLPIKTYTYLGIGRAILAPRLDDIAEVLHHDENAWLVEPDDLEAAVEGIRRLCSDRSLADRLGTQAAADSRLYTWETRAATIRDFIAARLAARA